MGPLTFWGWEGMGVGYALQTRNKKLVAELRRIEDAYFGQAWRHVNITNCYNMLRQGV